MVNLLIATRNRHKTGEIAAILGDAFSVCDLTGLPEIPEVEETGTTFLENATIKALSASKHFDGLVLADDSGLEVDALDGAPGVRSARYAGQGATDQQNLELLLTNLHEITSRTARFRCAIVVARNGVALANFDGHCDGRIIDSAAGTKGFGYDPIFVPDGYKNTFAELASEVKNSISHRAKAMASTVEWLRAHAGQNF